jgi:DNA-directed RNA polymerase specialized sigma24 family protein
VSNVIPFSAAARAEAAVRDALRAYVSRPENLAAMRKKVARKVPRDDVDDVVNVALTKALSTKSPPSSVAGIPGWIRTVVRRAIARYYRERQPRDEREVLTDLIDEYVDPSTELDWNVDGWLIRPWLERQVEGNDREEELFDILMEKANTGVTYEALAAKYGMTLTALSSRIFQFKKKYVPRFKRYKENAILLLLGGVAAILIAVALVLWLLRARPFDTEPPRPPSAAPTAPAFVPAPHPPSRDVSHPNPR